MRNPIKKITCKTHSPEADCLAMPLPRQRWRIYALGGGLGHFHRSLALGRIAAARGHEVHILANTRFAPHIPWQNELGPGGAVTIIPHSASRDITAAVTAKWLAADDYDRLVVDTFPRGLAGELPELLPSVRIPKILVHRDLNPEYVTSHQLAETVKQFDLLLLPGEDGPFAKEPTALRTAPWLIRDAAELLPAPLARRRICLDATDLRPVLVVCSTGQKEEETFYREVAQALRAQATSWCVRLASPFPRKGAFSCWPLLPLLTGVTALIGAGGYNLVHEARSTGTPLLAFAQSRRYDRQAIRLLDDELVDNLSMIMERLPELQGSQEIPTYPNGAHLAADTIERCVVKS
jgi:hypothetical protein